MENSYIFIKRLIFLALVCAGVYLFYMKITDNRVEKTIEDLVYINNMIKTHHMSTKYSQFTSDFLVYGNYLPVDMRTKKQDDGIYEVFSRFGGKLIFMESPLTEEEEKEYRYVLSSPIAYKNSYHGLSAFIASFSNLHRRECMLLAQTDWKKHLPNFIASEASFITGKFAYNGLDKLHMSVFLDDEYKDYAGADRGVVQRGPFPLKQARHACLCVLDNCTFAIKMR